MYRKVIDFRLGFDEQNSGSLKLNILVLEEMHMHINRVRLKGTNFSRMAFIIIDQFLYRDQISATLTKDYFLKPSKGTKNC